MSTQNIKTHFNKNTWHLWLTFFILCIFLTGCSNPQISSLISVQIYADGKTQNLQIENGQSVQQALQLAGIALGPLDQVTPPTYATLADQANISVTRIKEEFEIEEVEIPFERQIVKNESLPEGQTLLVQPGENGLRQITYRHLLENGIEVSNTVFKMTDIKEPKPEIIMVGIQSPFTPIPINGVIAFISNGNAWIMKGTTADRKPILTSGDLDGRVFSISPDQEWLLFSRSEAIDEKINSLWIINLTENNPEPKYLNVDNVIHFADWVPNYRRVITYSTVEPRPTAPGWQANNDLFRLSLSEYGSVAANELVLEANSGGIYGWWGTNFAWSPNGSALAYARPDSIGLIELENYNINPLVNLLPFQTRGDWAWVPGISWSIDESTLYTVDHEAMSGLASPEDSPLFNLTALPTETNTKINLINQSGMFAYPVLSQSNPRDEQIAFLKAIFPEQSETSRYNLMVMDKDGSNLKNVFPPQGAAGLEPQKIVWGSEPDNELDYPTLAFTYQGNLWLLNLESNSAKQITGDGAISKIDWK
jgi:hypothetical protein